LYGKKAALANIGGGAQSLTMHLQQAKLGKSGGPQYWLQNAPSHILELIQRHKKCPVILQTPYGPVETPFNAVDPDHKVAHGRVVRANAQHYRIQRGESKESIGEAIRRWFALDAKLDLERIEVDIDFDKQSRFILVPRKVKWRHKKRVEALPPLDLPLSFNCQHQSDLWKKQIVAVRKAAPDAYCWAAAQFKDFVEEYRQPSTSLISELDLLRLAGAFDRLGVRIGPYLKRGYDCPTSTFTFDGYPEYVCPVEIKKRSCGIKYQVANYKTLPRAAVLCLDHDAVHSPEHIDIVEVRTLASHLLSA
jgi:hypothetical protein